jgi:hypothetical protein
LREIIFRVRVRNDLAGQAAAIGFRLVDEHGKKMGEGTVPLPQAVKEVRMDALATAGKYLLTVMARTSNGKVLAEAQSTIHRLPKSPGSEVRIDENGNLVVNGRPQVFLGWYGSVPLDDPRRDVVALQNLQTPVVVTQLPDVTPVAEPFRKYGIMSIVSVETGRLPFMFKLWQKPNNTVATEHKHLSAPSAECRGYLRQLVEKLRDQPGLLGWYLADEPEISGYRADYLENTYHLLRELDPYHPVFVTNDTLDGIEKMGARACDVLNPDPYSPRPDHVPAFVQRARRVMRPGQALFLTPWQSARHTHFTDDYGTAPPYEHQVTRGQYLAAVAAGCRGFTGYTSPFFLPEPRLRYGLPHIWREVRFLEPATAAPAPRKLPQTSAESDLFVWLRETSGHLYLVAMRYREGPNPVTIRHPLLARAGFLDVVAEARKVEVRDAAIQDRLVPLPAGSAGIHRGRWLPIRERGLWRRDWPTEMPRGDQHQQARALHRGHTCDSRGFPSGQAEAMLPQCVYGGLVQKARRHRSARSAVHVRLAPAEPASV